MGKVLENQVAIVTGGSRGIGRAICKQLAEQGAFVYVNFTSRPDAAEETVKLCESVGGNAKAIQFDVSDSAAVDKAVDQIKTEKGRIDILVNNAGIPHDGLFMRLKDEDWQRVININLNGAFYCSRAVSRHMLKARSGRIVHITSVVGEMGNAGQAPYVSAKAALIGLTKSMAKEMAARSVTVNAVAPGFIDTDMTNNLSDELKQQYLSGIPLGRYGTGDEVASAVTFLAGPSASYITGEIIRVNGGLYM